MFGDLGGNLASFSNWMHQQKLLLCLQALLSALHFLYLFCDVILLRPMHAKAFSLLCGTIPRQSLVGRKS